MNDKVIDVCAGNGKPSYVVDLGHELMKDPVSRLLAETMVKSYNKVLAAALARYSSEIAGNEVRFAVALLMALKSLDNEKTVHIMFLRENEVEALVDRLAQSAHLLEEMQTRLPLPQCDDKQSSTAQQSDTPKPPPPPMDTPPQTPGNDTEKRMSVSSDKRKELGDALAKAWSGYTADCLCVAVQDGYAAERNYAALRKEVHSKAANVAVLLGILREQAGDQPVVGVVCLNQESFRHSMWFGAFSNSFEKLQNNALMVISDKGPYEFGFPKSPLTILDYALVGVNG